MLILRRNVGEDVIIADDIVVRVVEVGRNYVRLGFTAPKDIDIYRREVHEKIRARELVTRNQSADAGTGNGDGVEG